MNDLEKLQELLFLMQDQEKMIVLMEELQTENEQLAKDLQACRDELRACQETMAQKTQDLEEAMLLIEILNN